MKYQHAVNFSETIEGWRFSIKDVDPVRVGIDVWKEKDTIHAALKHYIERQGKTEMLMISVPKSVVNAHLRKKIGKLLVQLIGEE